MKIKSLLLGSAAASMLAVSGAQAADPIIYAEPETMEYVRICDVYGAGFFYIPGTETCMRISGFARYQMGWNSLSTPGNNGWFKYARGRLNFDVRSETEWGTLRGFVRLETNSGQAINDSGVTAMPWMFISMSTAQGELLAGYLESAWVWSGPLGNYGPTQSDTGAFSYGFQRRSQIRYTFTAPEGFFGVLSLEDNNGRVINGVAQNRQYMPDVVGKLGISQAWGGAYGAFGYDAVDESWTARVGGQINVPAAPGSSLRGEFYWANSRNNVYAPQMVYAAAPAAGGFSNGARWSAAVGYQHRFNPQFAAQVGYQYLSGFGAGNPHHHYVDGSLIWTPVQDLEIRTEVRYGNASQAGVRTDDWGGFLRFQRNF